MKYITLSADYSTLPMCANNLKLALKCIGKANLLHVPLWRVRKNSLHNVAQLSDNQLINLGVLNIKKQLNHHLGNNGKYSNRMIRRTASLKQNKSADAINLITSFPKNDLIAIIIATYTLLYTIDANYCATLLGFVEIDDYTGKDLNRNLPTRTICPIQSNIIIRSVGITAEEKVLIKKLQSIVKRR